MTLTTAGVQLSGKTQKAIRHTPCRLHDEPLGVIPFYLNEYIEASHSLQQYFLTLTLEEGGPIDFQLTEWPSNLREAHHCNHPLMKLISNSTVQLAVGKSHMMLSSPQALCGSQELRFEAQADILYVYLKHKLTYCTYT